MNANLSGIQAQLATPAFKAMVEAAWPYTLKILSGARDERLVEKWVARRRQVGGGLLILRYIPPGDERTTVADLPRLTEDSLACFAGWQRFAGDGILVVLEISINEKFHTAERDFADLAEASLPCAERIHAAGFVAGVLVTSEGNPPGPDYGVGFFLEPRVLAALRRFRQLGSVWVPHGYSHPPSAADDEYHFRRPAFILDRLPEDARLNYAYGEMGCDGGCDQPDKKPGQGYEAYFAPAEGRVKRYAAWVRPQVAAIAADPRCLGGAFFLSGADPAGRPKFTSFDVRDEVDFRPVLTERLEGPERVRLAGATTPPKEATMRLALLYRMGADVPEKNVDELVDLCRRGGFSAISPKAMDGDAWEGKFDGDPILAIKDTVDLAAQQLAYEEHGLGYEPWVVYRGFDAGAEAIAHATVGRICRTLVVDFEWRYPGFADRGTWEDAVRYFRLLREGAPGVRIVFCPDPRQIRRGEYDVAQVLPFVDVVSPQVYWTDFQQPWPQVLDEGLYADYGGRDVWPMLPGNSSPGDLDAALTRLENEWHSATPPTVYLFQRVGLRDANLDVLAKHAELGGGPLPVPEPAENPQEEPLLTVDKAKYEAEVWGPLYRRQQEDAALVAKLRATGLHSDALLADAIEKAAGVLQPTVSLHKVVCGAEAA